MKIAMIAVGVIVALALAVLAIGALLPRKHLVSRTRNLTASPEKVYALIAGTQEWRPNVKRYETVSENVARETTADGETITYETMEARPAEIYVRRIADKNLPFGGTWTYQLERTEGGTRLTITEDGEVYNPIFRFVSKFIIGQTHSIDDYMAALDARLKAK